MPLTDIGLSDRMGVAIGAFIGAATDDVGLWVPMGMIIAHGEPPPNQAVTIPSENAPVADTLQASRSGARRAMQRHFP